MVTTQFLLPLLRDVFLPFVVAFPFASVGSQVELNQSVDLIELNHYYDDSGRHAYDQIIFYEWSPDYRRYHVIAWCLVENDLDRMPTYDSHSELHRVSWQDRDLKLRRTVSSKLYRETWSQTDPERANKKLLEEKYRISLLRVDRQQCRR